MMIKIFIFKGVRLMNFNMTMGELIFFSILIFYIGWLNTSIREVKQRLTNIEKLLNK